MKAPDRHRWGLNLWVTDAEEAKLRIYFSSSRNVESLAEAARRLLLREVLEGSMASSVPREIQEALRDHQQVKNLLNGDGCRIGEDTPVAMRLLEFLEAPDVRVAWQRFCLNRSRL